MREILVFDGQLRPANRPAERLPRHQRRRPSAHARGYGAAWRKLRAVVLQAAPLCAECLARGRAMPAEVGHHVAPFDGQDDPARLDSENVRPLCRECHERLHGRLR